MTSVTKSPLSIIDMNIKSIRVIPHYSCHGYGSSNIKSAAKYSVTERHLAINFASHNTKLLEDGMT